MHSHYICNRCRQKSPIPDFQIPGGRSRSCLACRIEIDAHRNPDNMYKVVPDTGCWIWQRPPHSTKGYARIGVNGTRKMAHVFFYERKYGPVPKGLILDHFVCDNRMCVNPDHVHPVTYTVNNRRGKLAILCEAQVVEIKSMIGLVKGRELAKQYGVTESTISAIKYGRLWADVVV